MIEKNRGTPKLIIVGWAGWICQENRCNKIILFVVMVR